MSKCYLCFDGEGSGDKLTLESSINCQFLMEMMQTRSVLVKMIARETARSVLSCVSLAWLLLGRYKLCFLGLIALCLFSVTKEYKT